MLILQPPLLDHDAMMLQRFGTKVSVNGKLERRIVWNLFAHLERAGFKPRGIHDGDETTEVSSAKEAMELIFDLDEVHAYVQKDGRVHWLFLVLGNGIDIVSDWGVPEVSDGFDEAMSAFNAEDYA